MRILALVLFTFAVSVIFVPLALALGRFSLPRRALRRVDEQCDRFVQWCKA